MKLDWNQVANEQTGKPELRATISDCELVSVAEKTMKLNNDKGTLYRPATIRYNDGSNTHTRSVMIWEKNLKDNNMVVGEKYTCNLRISTDTPDGQPIVGATLAPFTAGNQFNLEEAQELGVSKEMLEAVGVKANSESALEKEARQAETTA